jgi:hypothetical protein
MWRPLGMTTTPTTTETTLPTAVEAFLERIATADWDGIEDHLTPDVLYDASVPGWHYQYQGAGRVAQEYREEWSGKYRWAIVERHTVADDRSVVLLVEMHGTAIRSGEHPPVVCRLSNLFRLREGRIGEHRYTCCGEWPPETVQHIAEHAPMVEGRTA